MGYYTLKPLIACLSISLSVISCNKSTDAAPGSPASGQVLHLDFSKEALSYVQLPEDRYFIYKDSATGVSDSIIVSQSAVEDIYMPAQNNGDRPAFFYQKFTLLLRKANGFSEEDWVYATAQTNGYYFTPASTYTELWLYEKDRALNTDRGVMFLHPLKGQPPRSLTIGSHTYPSVARYETRSGLYYWVKDTGIIQRTIQTPASKQTWMLVRTGKR